MTRKTCNDHLYIDIVVKLCREILHISKFNKVWESSSLESDNYFNLFLKENEISLEKLIPFIQMTRNKMPRTRASSMCYKTKHSPISPAVDFGHRLRARRHTAYNNFVDTSGDEDSNHIRPMRELRSSSRISVNQIKQHDSDLWDSGRPKRTCIKQKRPSPDERLVFDNKTYYKVEVMSNKLRSVRERKIKSPVISEESEDDKVYNNKKHKRMSEITRLNNEAENFLFPNKDDSSTDNETETTDTPNHKKELQNDTKPNKIIKHEPEEESSMDSVSSESSLVKKKRRLTHAEAFILDNQRYYKFETPGSRLRYQGSYLSPIASKNNGEYGVKHLRMKELVKDKDKPKLELEDLKFSFEVVPSGEPWYSTFQRQDKGEECYNCYNYFSGYKPFLLPYEMGPLPPLNPRVCYSVYDRMKKEIIVDMMGPSTSEACSTPDLSNVDTLKTDYNSSTGDDTKSSEDVSMETVCAEKIHRKSKRRKVVGGRNPRKSPRQHASTLAILSSLIHQRKRRDFNRQRTLDQRVKNNLSVIREEKEQENDADYLELTRSIDDMLLNTYGEIKLEDSLPNDGVNVNVHCRPSAVKCLEEYGKCDETYNGARHNKLHNVAVRKPNRKKKKNRTGWPNKNRRHVFRKEGSTESVSIKNNCVDSEENSSDNNFNKRNKNKNSFSNKLLNVNKMNGDVQINKLNGEICFKNVGMPKRKEHRESSSENCAEVVIPSVGDKIDCVNVDLAKWENAEKLLAAKIRYEDINNDILFQPIVRVQKLDTNIEEKCTEKQFKVSTPKRSSRPRRMPASPKSPRMLRRPRGGWYRDRY